MIKLLFDLNIHWADFLLPQGLYRIPAVQIMDIIPADIDLFEKALGTDIKIIVGGIIDFLG